MLGIAASRSAAQQADGGIPWRSAGFRADSSQQQAEPPLGIAFRARFELKLDQLRNERCSSADLGRPLAGCQGGFPTPFLDQQFDLRAGGVLAERIHVNVDYASQREFSASNVIRVWYEGAAGDLLRRVEVGNVSLATPGSRFITAAIPANSFGLQAQAQFGNLEVRSILAQQRGSSLRSRVFSVGEQTTQPVDFELRDVDFETGRFFFVVNPRQLPAYPAIDVFDLRTETLPSSLRPVEVRVYRVRALGGGVGANPTLGGITAVAVRDDSPQRVGPLPWELLVEGRDYYLDPSGTWFALATRAGNEDFLAVSYLTAAGVTVGTLPSVSGGSDTLYLVHEPRRGAEVPTFFHEMRNAYRLGGSDLVRSSIEVAVLLNRSERPLTGEGTYLALLDLARAADPSALDDYSRIFPRERDPNGGAPIRDLFLLFPHLTPFADSTRLGAAERADSLYRTPTHLLDSQGPASRFRLRVHAEASGAGDAGTLNLGALQIREGSERLYVGDRELLRGRDYEIFYDIGQVTFLDPAALFGGPVTQVRVQFEENQLFDLAPKSIVGLTTTYRLGSHGQVDAIGLWQREQSVFTRPQLGFEPQSHFIGGVSTSLRFEPDAVTRAVNALPLVETEAPSSLVVNGELAVSRPNVNAAGIAYLEEFEGGGASRAISVAEQSFQLGSRPSSGRGLPLSHLASDGTFDPRDAAALIWQNGTQIRNEVVEFSPRDIDSTIVVAGASRQLERVLWLSLKPDTVGGAPHPVSGAPRWVRPHTPGPRWRSITQALDRSGLGVDLSTTEFLEFWVLEDEQRTARLQQAVLLLDFGTVFEDALVPAPDTVRLAGDTTFTGLRFIGVGRLDTEKDTVANVFNAQVHDVGILADRLDTLINAATGQPVHDLATCRGGPALGLPIFPLGDLSARCTRGNGLLDTEDLNGDNRLDQTVGVIQEDLLRYVFPIGDDRYFVRQGGSLTDATGRRLVWRLYRLPFREDTLLIGTPDLRHVAALRLTLVAPDQGGAERELFIALARMRLQGAPWLKRAPSPIAGLGGQVAQPHGEVIASIVGTDNRDLGYTPPPGVGDLPERRGLAFQFTSQQINERSLRLLARDLRRDERAEAFTRFAAEADRNFLAYRELRLWVQGRGAGWDQGDLEFFVKAGSDEHNFYLYRESRSAGTWDPEVVITLERWLALRAAIETAWHAGAPPSGWQQCGGDSTAYVACDGPYFLQIRDPGVAPPNLALVSEIAVGMLRVDESVVVDPAEVWVDDIRLTGVVSDPGMAAALEARFVAADLAEIDLVWTRRDDRFRQLGERPSYLTTQQARIGGTVRLEKLFPESFGVSLPLTVRHARTGEQPFYLRRSDVLADALDGLRRPASAFTTYQLSFRRTRPGTSALERLLLDPLTALAVEERGEVTTELSRARTTNRQLRVDYAFQPASRSVRVYLGTQLLDYGTDRQTFRAPVALPGESSLTALPSITHVWRNRAGLELRPLQTVSVQVEYGTLRDLQDYGDSTQVGRLLRDQRATVFGQNIGFERERTMTTGLSAAPAVSTWLRPRLSVSSGFSLRRDPNVRRAVLATPDTAGPFRVPLATSNFRRRMLGARVDVARLATPAPAGGGAIAAIARALLPADVSHAHERRSVFDRVPDVPGLGYHLALGGVEAFRELDGLAAATAVETAIWTAAGGVQFPLGLQVRLNFRDTDGTTWIRRGPAQTPIDQTSTEWPSGTASWSHRPGGVVGRVIRAVDARAQLRTTETVIRQGEPDGSPVVSENHGTTFTPSLSLTWLGDVTTSAQYGRTTGTLLAAGNLTETERTDLNGALAFAFRPPEWLWRSRNPLRATVSGSASDVLVCLTRGDAPACLPVADSRRRQLDVKLDTGFSPSVVGGASFSYIHTDQRHLSSRFSQIVFTVFADINFVAGRLP